MLDCLLVGVWFFLTLPLTPARIIHEANDSDSVHSRVLMDSMLLCLTNR